jgi:hypothetical protein
VEVYIRFAKKCEKIAKAAIEKTDDSIGYETISCAREVMRLSISCFIFTSLSVAGPNLPMMRPVREH